MVFKRHLRSHHVFAIAAGATISSAYFLGNGYLLKELGPLSAINFLFAGFITFLVMKSLTDLVLSEKRPGHHSFVGYAREYISPAWACGIGWSYWLEMTIFAAIECTAAGILLNLFFPTVSVYFWAMLSIGFVTYLNLSHVKIFASASYLLTFTHMLVFIGFAIFALLIFFGYIGTDPHFLGLEYFWNSKQFFPNGIGIFFTTMIIFVLNFIGCEIIGLSASETINHKTAFPKIARNITYTITTLFFLPLFLLPFIFPWQDATSTNSIFAKALELHGLVSVASVFNFLLIVGSLTCANSAVYASIRTLHAMSELRMSPKYLEKTNTLGIPARAALVTIAPIFLILQLLYFFPVHEMYIEMLVLAGASGAIAWNGITFSHIKAFPKNKTWYSRLAFALLTFFLICACFNKDLRVSFYAGLLFMIGPMIIYKLQRR